MMAKKKLKINCRTVDQQEQDDIPALDNCNQNKPKLFLSGRRDHEK